MFCGKGETMKQIIRVITLTMIMAMMISSNVFGATSQELEISDMHSYIGEIYREDVDFIRYTSSGVRLNVDMSFYMEYSYEEGYWSQINDISMQVRSVSRGDYEVSHNEVSIIDYRVFNNSAYLIIRVGDIEVKVVIEVDEYGEIHRDAYEW